MSKYLPNNVKVVPKNVPGAGGRRGYAELARAKPDGYTICVINFPGAAIPSLTGQKTTYDINQFKWVARMSNSAYLIAASGKNETIKRFADLKTAGRAIKVTHTGFGSTSYAVAAHAQCPVVIVRAAPGGDSGDIGDTGDTGDTVDPRDLENLPRPNRPDATHPVLVGSDDSPPSERAVDAAAEAAAVSGARLHIVRVAESLHTNTLTIVEAGASDGGEEGGQDPHPTLAGTEDSLNQIAERVRTAHPSLEVTTEAVQGEPGAMLGELGKDAGLIVVGSRGRGGFTGMLLGSVSHRVIHDAVCPVMVVR